MSEGLRRAGFDVTGVDIRDLAKHHRGGTFVQADALTYPLDGFDFVHASPPCQAHSSLRHLHPEKEYPDLIEPVRERLRAWDGPYSIENVPGAPLGGGAVYLVQLCGSMFGLQTPDGRAYVRRHRLFELNWCPGLVPACQHWPVDRVLTVTGTHGLPGKGARERQALSVTGNSLNSNRERWARGSLNLTGHAIEISPSNRGERRVICVAGGKAISGGMSEPQGVRKRRAAMSVTGSVPQRHTSSDYGANITRETFSVDDARAAMGIDWMPMRFLSQAIPPVYGEWVGRQALRYLGIG